MLYYSSLKSLRNYLLVYYFYLRFCSLSTDIDCILQLFPFILLQLYDTSVEVKLNDVIEVVGVLSVDPSLAVFPQSTAQYVVVAILVVAVPKTWFLMKV